MLIKNIRIVDDTQDFIADVLIEGDKIIKVEKIENIDDETLDFINKPYALLPAFTDLHAHFRDPGFTYKEDLLSGSQAALKGGYTAVNLMPNTKPVCSTLELVRDVENRAAQVGLIHVNQTLSMTKNLEGKELSDLKTLKEGEILFVSDDGKGVADDHLMRDIFKICKEKKITIMSHAEDPRFSATDMRMAENSMTFRDLKLFKEIGGQLHFCHVSTKEAIEAIEDAQKQGHQVSCEVTPHHIFANRRKTGDYKVNPPFRDDKDIEALIAAMQRGAVAAIATDHAPHTAEDKQNGAPGMIGLELAFPLCYTKLVRGNKLSLSQLVALMATNPAAMMQLNKGKIKAGYDADLVIVDLENSYQITVSDFVSKSKNTPFIGETVYGKIIHTIRLGKRFK